MCGIGRRSGTHDQGHLEQTAQLVLVLYARLGMHEAALVRDRTITADEGVVGDGLAKDLDLEHVCDDLLCLAIDVGVHECDVVVGGDNVAESGETLLDALDGDCVWEGIAEVLEFLVGGRRGDEEAVSVSCAAMGGAGTGRGRAHLRTYGRRCGCLRWWCARWG
jgi:hypothetical protein